MRFHTEEGGIPRFFLEYPPIDVVVTQFRAHAYIQVPANVYHQIRGSQFERKSVDYPTKPEEPMPLIISICGLIPLTNSTLEVTQN